MGNIDSILFGDNVQGKKEGDPKVSEAHNYFMEVTLPRYKQKEGGEEGDFRLVEPGEPGGLRYSVWGTPLKQLGDFGLGIGLYFSTLLGMAGVLFFCAIINSYTIDYYRSEEYSGEQEGLSGSVKGSAVCTAYVNVTDITGTETFPHYTCEVKAAQGVLDLVTICLLLVFSVVVAKSQDKLVEMLDEAEQTTQDYSVLVEDPDEDAVDPDEWHRFFSMWGHVTYVTVALNNGPLMEALGRARVLRRNISYESSDSHAQDLSELNSSSLLDNVPGWKQKVQGMGFMRDLRYWQRMLVAEEHKIEEYKLQQYIATRVFITYETEAGQRACLADLATGIIPAMLEQSDKIKDEHKFRGTNVLKVDEPVEPSEVLWENLHVPLKTRMIQQTLTLLLGVGMIAASAGIISALPPSGAALFISLSNAGIPIFLKIITNLEHHLDAGDKQGSLLRKMILARWVNTAIIVYLLNSFKDTLSEENIHQIYAILLADAFTTPILRVLDLPTRLTQWIVAPLAPTQDKMNSYFCGTPWTLAERYTDMSKTIFVSFFFFPLFPAGIYITVAALLMNYWVDKFCLLRRWKTPPALDESLAVSTRGHFLFTILVHLLMSARYYAGWPYDGLCPETDADGAILVDATSGRLVYRECDQTPDGLWHPGTGPWMTDDQTSLVHMFAATGLILTIALSVIYFGKEAYYSFMHLFYGGYEARGEDQNIDYSSVEGIFAYVPQIEVAGLGLPLLACDLTRFDVDHISWTGDFEANCICSDADLPGTTAKERGRWFSPCQHYPPARPAAAAAAARSNGNVVSLDDTSIEMMSGYR